MSASRYGVEQVGDQGILSWATGRAPGVHQPSGRIDFHEFAFQDVRPSAPDARCAPHPPHPHIRFPFARVEDARIHPPGNHLGSHERSEDSVGRHWEVYPCQQSSRGRVVDRSSSRVRHSSIHPSLTEGILSTTFQYKAETEYTVLGREAKERTVYVKRAKPIG